MSGEWEATPRRHEDSRGLGQQRRNRAGYLDERAETDAFVSCEDGRLWVIASGPGGASLHTWEGDNLLGWPLVLVGWLEVGCDLAFTVRAGHVEREIFAGPVRSIELG